jgi:hypothetical protein
MALCQAPPKISNQTDSGGGTTSQTRTEKIKKALVIERQNITSLAKAGLFYIGNITNG